jgi:hypothetical protein
VRDYLAEIANLPRHRKARWWSLLAEFPVWRASLAVGRSPIDDAWPWFTFGAIRRTRHLLRPGFRVFEFGAGGSTLCFLGRESSVVTVDHDRQWIDRVAAVVRQKGYANWKPLVQPPVASAVAAYAAPEDPDGYVSSGTEYRGLSFEAYAASIDDYDDETFDLVVVDGRARPSCGKHARPKVKPGGYLILDNSERATYSWIHDDLANRAWEAEHFYGPGPYNRGFWQTSIYRRPFLARP